MYISLLRLNDKKKDDPDVYLRDFVEDMSILEVTGLDCINRSCKIEFSKLISDAVAKSKIFKH